MRSTAGSRERKPTSNRRRRKSLLYKEIGGAGTHPSRFMRSNLAPHDARVFLDPTKKQPMIQSPIPTPPEDLGEDGRALWLGVLDSIDLEEAHLLELLGDACRQADRAAEARKRIAVDGAFVVDRFQQVKEHPAIALETRSHLAKLRLLRECGLDVEGLHQEIRAPRRVGT